MPKIKYLDIRFTQQTASTVEQATEVVHKYSADGYVLTLRQLYYQMVARGIIENTERSYKRLGRLISRARLGGYIDWYAIEDRTRNRVSLTHWESPKQLVQSAAQQYRRDHWELQTYAPEIWIEKEALANVVDRVARKYDVPYFCCRGYASSSEMWRAAQRFSESEKHERIPVVIYLGDHDPSGLDMVRDITDRLNLMVYGSKAQGIMHVKHIALHMEQIHQYDPPPNPVKVTDTRHDKYVAQYGHSCWELDALEPQVLAALIEASVLTYREEYRYNTVIEREEKENDELQSLVAGMLDPNVRNARD